MNGAFSLFCCFAVRVSTLEKIKIKSAALAVPSQSSFRVKTTFCLKLGFPVQVHKYLALWLLFFVKVICFYNLFLICTHKEKFHESQLFNALNEIA